MAKTLELAFVMAGKMAPSFMDAAKNATAQLAAVEKKTKDIQKASERRASAASWKNFTAQIGKAKSAMGGLKTEVAGTLKVIGGLVAGNGLLGGSIYGIAKSSANYADNAIKSAQAAGMNTAAFTELSYAAKMAGVSNQDFVTAAGKMNKLVEDALSGNAKAIETLDRAQIKLYDGAGNLKASEQLWTELSDSFASMPDGIGKSALAMDIFGRAGTKLIPLLNGGSDAMNQLRADALRMGISLSDTDAKNAEAFNDSFANIGESIRGVTLIIGKELWPVLTKVHDAIGKWIASNGEIIAQNMPAWIEKLEQGWADLQPRLESAWQDIQGIAIYINDVVQGMGGWVPVIEGVVTAWLGWRALRMGASLVKVGKEVRGAVSSFLDLQYAGTSVRGALGAVTSGFKKAAVASAKFAFNVGKSAVTGLASFAKTAAVSAVGALKSFAAAAWPAIAAAIKFSVALMANPIGLIVAGIAALVGALYLVYKYWDDIVAFLKSVWDMLPGWVQEPLTKAYENVVSFGKQVGDAFVSMWEAVKGFFLAKGASVVEAFDSGIISGLLKAFWEFSPVAIIGQALMEMVNYIAGFDVGEAAMGLIKRFTDGLLSAWASLKDGVVSALTDWIPGGGAIAEAASSAASAASSAASWVGGKLASISPFAEGGIVRTPQLAMIGEAGPEVVVPVTRPRRARELMGAAAGMMGLGGNTGGSPAITVTFAPSISIAGDVDKNSIVPQISQTLSDKITELEAMLRDITYNDNRIALW